MDLLFRRFFATRGRPPRLLPVLGGLLRRAWPSIAIFSLSCSARLSTSSSETNRYFGTPGGDEEGDGDGGASGGFGTFVRKVAIFECSSRSASNLRQITNNRTLSFGSEYQYGSLKRDPSSEF